MDGGSGICSVLYIVHVIHSKIFNILTSSVRILNCNQLRQDYNSCSQLHPQSVDDISQVSEATLTCTTINNTFWFNSHIQFITWQSSRLLYLVPSFSYSLTYNASSCSLNYFSHSLNTAANKLKHFWHTKC